MVFLQVSIRSMDILFVDWTAFFWANHSLSWLMKSNGIPARFGLWWTCAAETRWG